VTAKLVVRVLDAGGRLLGWVAHPAAVRGDGTLRASADVSVPIMESGGAAVVSWHWCDPNVEIRVPVDTAVAAGQVWTVKRSAEVILQIGPAAGGLPPVVVGRIEVPVPPGAVGAKGL